MRSPAPRRTLSSRARTDDIDQPADAMVGHAWRGQRARNPAERLPQVTRRDHGRLPESSKNRLSGEENGAAAGAGAVGAIPRLPGRVLHSPLVRDRRVLLDPAVAR